jgi:glycosyltransferase involved in cell wall biosynthesis
MISIIIPSFNSGKYVESTIQTILDQKAVDFEVIVVDGGSTDETLKNLSKFDSLKVVSENDYGYGHAFRKGLAIAKGEFIVQCCLSDGFLNENWFENAVKLLKNDSNISLVWGFPIEMDEKGELGKVSFTWFTDENIPNGKEMFYYWLATGFFLPEGNFVVRRNVIEECFPPASLLDCKPFSRTVDPFMEFNFKFHKNGYLSRNINTVVNYGRIHKNSITEIEKNNNKVNQYRKNYEVKRIKYLISFLINPHCHKFINESKEIITENTSRAEFLKLFIKYSIIIIRKLKKMSIPYIFSGYAYAIGLGKLNEFFYLSKKNEK